MDEISNRTPREGAGGSTLGGTPLRRDLAEARKIARGKASTASAKATAVKEEGTGVAKALFVTALTACALSIACAEQLEPPREITLVARGMTFVLENGGEPNPVITLRAGERVRLVLENEAPGLLHDIEIPEWGVAVGPIRAGERTDVTFVVPDAPGRYEYRCRPHAEMMRGPVEVTH